MATKAQMYAQMADHAAVQLTSSWNEWMRFLDTASRLYKYPFHDQLMIYAQRPDATACAEYDLWNDKMGRYVRRGSKGIALVDDSGDRTRLRYVFDISDTGTRAGLMERLTEMRGYLSPEETELMELTDSALHKLRAMTDAEFDSLELYPDFDE